jgi:hypothetical protein
MYCSYNNKYFYNFAVEKAQRKFIEKQLDSKKSIRKRLQYPPIQAQIVLEEISLNHFLI